MEKLRCKERKQKANIPCIHEFQSMNLVLFWGSFAQVWKLLKRNALPWPTRTPHAAFKSHAFYFNGIALQTNGVISLNSAVGVGKLGFKKLKSKAKQNRTFYSKW
jgi:hypothetical protein